MLSHVASAEAEQGQTQSKNFVSLLPGESTGHDSGHAGQQLASHEEKKDWTFTVAHRKEQVGRASRLMIGYSGH